MNDDALASAQDRLQLLRAAADRLGGMEQLSENLALHASVLEAYRRDPGLIPVWVAIACRQIVTRLGRG